MRRKKDERARENKSREEIDEDFIDKIEISYFRTRECEEEGEKKAQRTRTADKINWAFCQAGSARRTGRRRRSREQQPHSVARKKKTGNSRGGNREIDCRFVTLADLPGARAVVVCLLNSVNGNSIPEAARIPSGAFAPSLPRGQSDVPRSLSYARKSLLLLFYI